MGRGHGGSRGGGPGGGISDRTMQGYSSTLAKAMKEREESIRGNNDFETGFVFDEHGNMTFTVKGNRDHIEFDRGTTTNKILTHNHPAYYDEKGRVVAGNSLSDRDVIAAVIDNPREVRVISGNYRFSMKRTQADWGTKESKIRAKVAGARRAITGSLQKYIDNYKGDKTTALARAQQVEWHLFNKRMSQTLGYSYTKQRIN